MSLNRWITARYNSNCTFCRVPVLAGDRVFFLPDDLAIVCPTCVEDNALEDADTKAEE